MKKDTVVLYPAPGMGHIISMVELGKLVLRESPPNSITISILITTGPYETPAITSYITRISHNYHPSITFHRFPHLSVDTGDRSRSPAAIMFDIIGLNTLQHFSHYLHHIAQTDHHIRALIIDPFCFSALPIAAQRRIPTYYFYTSGASALAAFFYLPKIAEQMDKSFKDLTSTYLHFPGLPKLLASHLPEPVLDRNDPAYGDFIYLCSDLSKADGVIVNTFEDLEPIPVRAIADGCCVAEAPTPPVYYIGPIIADSIDKEVEKRHECLVWLDSQPNGSVLFLCFGSRGSFSEAQVREIAIGLERKEQRFLWVVRAPPRNTNLKHVSEYEDKNFDLNQVLPDGFVERTKGRGLVVEEWAPQVEVLNHKAVGGFVSHCGWNSTLEAVVAGVPMIAWPLYAEQHLNRAALVEDMKMAIGVEMEDDEFVSGSELEKRVRELMASEKGREMRERSFEMRERALKAWEEQGYDLSFIRKHMKIDCNTITIIRGKLNRFCFEVDLNNTLVGRKGLDQREKS
ncbi:UDP-glucuronosyl/UDP-glucosyltransferase [Dillenia turbinata]|uniref:Glycosyltransferase n=1 Tax=Dillenia turbinata TaxID=194707 RepID=A0AAN8ZHI7_9MAGN